jgi:hypothetical protein
MWQGLLFAFLAAWHENTRGAERETIGSAETTNPTFARANRYGLVDANGGQE